MRWGWEADGQLQSDVVTTALSHLLCPPHPITTTMGLSLRVTSGLNSEGFSNLSIPIHPKLLDSSKHFPKSFNGQMPRKQTMLRLSTLSLNGPRPLRTSQKAPGPTSLTSWLPVSTVLFTHLELPSEGRSPEFWSPASGIRVLLVGWW